jgi:uncharacterized damage-inducible protein DinB
MTDLRYPIGKWARPSSPLSDDERRAAIDRIAGTPARLRAAVRGLSDAQLDTPYREGGWTVRQVVHHVPDSHLNAYVRFKLALTEDNPTIKPYNESAWAKLVDTAQTPPETSLSILELLHARWLTILRSMSAADFALPLYHPENGQMALYQMLSLYAWHGDHHTAHITSLRERMQWS